MIRNGDRTSAITIQPRVADMLIRRRLSRHRGDYERGRVTSLDDIIDRLVELRIDSGNPSFTTITDMVYRTRLRRGLSAFEARTARTTVYSVFQKGRRRLDAQLVCDVAVALGCPADEARKLSRQVGLAQQVNRSGGDRRSGGSTSAAMSS